MLQHCPITAPVLPPGEGGQGWGELGELGKLGRGLGQGRDSVLSQLPQYCFNTAWALVGSRGEGGGMGGACVLFNNKKDQHY